MKFLCLSKWIFQSVIWVACSTFKSGSINAIELYQILSLMFDQKRKGDILELFQRSSNRNISMSQIFDEWQSDCNEIQCKMTAWLKNEFHVFNIMWFRCWGCVSNNYDMMVTLLDSWWQYVIQISYLSPRSVTDIGVTPNDFVPTFLVVVHMDSS